MNALNGNEFESLVVKAIKDMNEGRNDSEAKERYSVLAHYCMYDGKPVDSVPAGSEKLGEVRCSSAYDDGTYSFYLVDGKYVFTERICHWGD